MEKRESSSGVIDVKSEQEEISVTFPDTSGLPCYAPVSTEEDIKLDSNASTSAPQKKRRLIMEVVLPTLERLKLEKKSVEDEVKKLFKVRNPNRPSHDEHA